MFKIASNILWIVCAYILAHIPESVVVGIWFVAFVMLFSSISLVFLPQ